MLEIIHGQDIVSSRNYYLLLKTQKSDVMSFDGETVGLTDIVQSAEGGGLFGSEATIFIDNLLSKRKAGKETEAILSYLRNSKKGTDVYLWEGKELTKAKTSSFPKSNIRHFPLPQTLFFFLDKITPGDTNNCKYFHNALLHTGEELILFMLIRQFRLLLGVFSESKSAENADEVKRLSPWQRKKIEAQSRFFSTEKLMFCYESLYKIDLGVKTGTLSLPLVAAIDFFLLTI